MLNTIVSRCQIFTFGKNKVEEFKKYKEIKENVTLNKLLFSIWKISDSNCPLDEYKVFIDNVIRFIRKYEVEGLKTILYSKSYFHDFFKEKEEILKFYECMILFYTDVLNYKLNEHIMYYDDYLDDIKKISSKNKLSQIINKLNVITIVKRQ
jgi:DNA polymerase III gamma/tau subunit